MPHALHRFVAAVCLAVLLPLPLVAAETVADKPAPAPAPAKKAGARVAVPRQTKAPVRELTVKLTLENGHIPAVFLSCRDGATAGFDPRIDVMAPPAGIGGIGFTCLIPPDREHNLYRDVRPFGDVVQWLLYAKPGGKPIKVSWEPDQLPATRDLFCGRWDGKSQDMTDVINCRETREVTTDSLCFFRFWMVPAKPGAKAPAADEATD
jgi:hypothetical protein